MNSHSLKYGTCGPTYIFDFFNPFQKVIFKRGMVMGFCEMKLTYSKRTITSLYVFSVASKRCSVIFKKKLNRTDHTPPPRRVNVTVDRHFNGSSKKLMM